MIRNSGPLTKPSIPFQNALQTELISVIEFAEMIADENQTQLQTALERMRYGYRAVNSFKDTVINIQLRAQQVYSIPVYGIYAIGLVKDSWERLPVRQINNPVTTQGLVIQLIDRSIQIKATEPSLFTVFLEFELEVAP